MAEFVFKSIGILGATGKIDITREMVTAKQFLRMDGRFDLVINLNGLDALAIPAHALLDVTLKDNSISDRDERTVGAWGQIDRERVEIVLDRELNPNRSQIYLHFVDPTTARLYASSEEIRLEVPDDRKVGPSSHASFIYFAMDDKQELPIRAIVDTDGPLVRIGKMGPESVQNSRADLAFMSYGMPAVLEKFILALLTDEGNRLSSPRWDAMKDRIAAFDRVDSWADVKAQVVDLAPYEVQDKAETLALEFLKYGNIREVITNLYRLSQKNNEEA